MLRASDVVPAGASAAPITVASTTVTYVNTAAVTATTEAVIITTVPATYGNAGDLSCGIVAASFVLLSVFVLYAATP